MCRWLACAGLPPDRQSVVSAQKLADLAEPACHSGRHHTDGDGFGLGWYGERNFPGQYRDTMPARHEANLRSLSEQIRSRRSSPMCERPAAPPAAGKTAIRSALSTRCSCITATSADMTASAARSRICPSEIYGHRAGHGCQGFFLLAIGNGLLEDPDGAFARSIAAARDLMAPHDIEEPFRMTAALADGERLYAVRYASGPNPPGLFVAEGEDITVEAETVRISPGRGSVVVLSEPLDMHEELWCGCRPAICWKRAAVRRG